MGTKFIAEFGYSPYFINVMANLHIDSILKSFGAKKLLTDIFISCKPGEIVGLLGRNGSGKSTLLKIIFGTMSAEQKYIKIGDKLINGLSDNRHLVKYLPQNSYLPNHIPVSRILSLFCEGAYASLLLENELIKPLLKKKSKQLSGGEKRLVEILLILHSETKFVLMDEPFNGIAPIYKEYIKNLIREHSKTKGFIITDHDYRNILDVSTTTILLHDGGTKRGVTKEELLKWGYFAET